MLSWLKNKYYWVIVITMMLVFCAYGGLANNLSSIFIIPVTEDLGMSRGEFSFAVSVRSMTLFIFMSVSGVAFRKFGVKIPAILGLLMMAAGFAMLSVSNTVLTIAIGCAFLGIGEAFTGGTAGSQIVSNWFHRSRGAIYGLISSCTGIGGAILSVILSSAIATVGWRNTRLLSALILIIAVLLVISFLRNNPSDVGLTPYGEGYVPKQKKHHREDAHWMGPTFKELLGKPTFYLAILAFFLAGVVIYAAFSNIAPHLQDQGLSASEAAFQNSLLLVYLAVFKIVCGSLSDVIGPKWVCAICMVFGAVGLWMLSDVSTVSGATIAVLIYSVSVPTVLVMIPLVSYPLFGYRSHDSTLGIFLALPYLGSLVAVPVTNAVYDKVGTYEPVFRLAAILSIIVLGILLILYWLAQKEQKKYLANSENLI